MPESGASTAYPIETALTSCSLGGSMRTRRDCDPGVGGPTLGLGAGELRSEHLDCRWTGGAGE